MKIRQFAALLVAVTSIPFALVVVACGGGGSSGAAGTACPDWPGQCVGGTHCHNNVCTPCGGPGEDCCLNGCRGGLSCDSPGGHGMVCSGCGAIGAACCHNNGCQPGGSCDVGTQRCVASTCTGPNVYAVGTERRDNGCAGPSVSQAASSPEAAVACVDASLGSASEFRTVPAGSTLLADRAYCVTDESNIHTNYQVSAYSTDNLASCARSQCGPRCTSMEGACP